MTRKRTCPSVVVVSLVAGLLIACGGRSVDEGHPPDPAPRAGEQPADSPSSPSPEAVPTDPLAAGVSCDPDDDRCGAGLKCCYACCGDRYMCRPAEGGLCNKIPADGPNPAYPLPGR